MACCGVQTQDSYCSIQLLNGSEVNMNLEGKMKGSHILDRVFSHLNLIETDYFGLRFIDADNHTHWLNPEKIVTKQLKTVNPMTLYFGVKFYVEDPSRIAEEVTRYQFFLQLKMDMLQGRLPCSFSLAAELFAYAVQSELGDYDAELHPEGYVSEFRFIPNQTEELEKAISEYHQKLKGMEPAKAELGFLERAKRLEMYGVDLTPVTGEDHMGYFLGTTPSGVVVYRNKTRIALYAWSKISQINFRQSEFKIILGDEEFVWLLPSRSSCKHLFQCYVEQHMFFRMRASTLERNGTLTKSLKSNGSRYSFRTQEEALQNSMRLRRPEPKVQRVPSRRYLRRVSTNDADDSHYIDHSSLMMSPSPALENGMVPQGRVTVAPTPVRRPQSQLGGRESPTSGISIRSVPWEETDGALSDRGMYTQRGESPVSTRSAHRSRRPHSRSTSPATTRRRNHQGDRSGSETESLSSRKYRYRRSLTGSEASGDEMSHRRRRRRRRSRSRESSGSEGEHRHRSRRSRSRDHMVESQAQWNAVQTGEVGQRGEVREPGEAVVKNLKNGVASPEDREEYKWYKGRRQLADIKASNELRKHIQLGLQDPNMDEEDQNYNDIPYTNIVTDAGVAVRVSHSPTRQRSRPNSGVYRRSRGDYPDETESQHSAKGSVHSMRSIATRRTDPNPHSSARSGKGTMPLDLVQSGPVEGHQVRTSYESDDQRGRRRQRGPNDGMSSGRAETGGDIPSYLLAQKGQGMFGQKPGNNADHHTTSAINKEMYPQSSHTRREMVEADQSHPSQSERSYPPPPAYSQAPAYKSSQHHVANGNPGRPPGEGISSRPREDYGYEQEKDFHHTSRSHNEAVIPNTQSSSNHVRTGSNQSYQGPIKHHPQPSRQHEQHLQPRQQQHQPQRQQEHHPQRQQEHHPQRQQEHHPLPSRQHDNHPQASRQQHQEHSQPLRQQQEHHATTRNPPLSATTMDHNHLPSSKPPSTTQHHPKESWASGNQKAPAGDNPIDQGFQGDAKPPRLMLPNGGPHHQHRSSYDASMGRTKDGQPPPTNLNGLYPPQPRSRIHSKVDILAVSELLDELDKLGKGARGSNRSGRSVQGVSLSSGVGGGGGEEERIGSRQGSYNARLPPPATRQLHTQPQPDFIPKQDVQGRQATPFKVSGDKRMSLTTQEILRVSRSGGRNHNMLTEL